eukprot:TRINITY_DN454_c0_g1_i3.p1 TRINITY_DN454_c0_g1~~TRINITY_DN454_c0_g1_i3.p1  ORF type:complete len:192 (-),score=20.02 TRINITY_DN454_c0_g1_i3:11-586(-)
MRTLQSTRDLPIPAGVTVKLKSRKVSVTGPKGTLTREFKHVPIDLKIVKHKKGLAVRAEVWFGQRKQIATIRTVVSHIQNMIDGVTKGFKYKMRLVYAHFPISATIEKEGREVHVRNFLGEKIVRQVPMLGTVKVERSNEQKDEIILTGTDIQHVSQSAANIQQCCRVKDKDIRKFLDGVYVSAKGVVKEE